MTGSFCCGAGLGVQTLRYRQSSVSEAAFMSTVDSSCAQRPPNAFAERVSVQGSGFCGSFQRKFPTGGFAYGIPRKLRTSLASLVAPSSGPDSTLTIKELVDGLV